MSKAKITLIGFYNYMLSVNDDLFKNLHTPDGISKDLLVNNILLKGGDFEVLYAEPYFYQNMIGIWSDKWQRTMEKWINALSIDYNPLENYDRMEDWTDDASRIANEQKAETASNASNASALNSINNSSNSSEEHTNNTFNDELSSKTESAITEDSLINERSAFDSSSYQPHDKETKTNLTGTTGDVQTVASLNDEGHSNNETEGNQTSISQNTINGDESRTTDSNAIDNSSSTHSGRMHGNIGVTTSQQMLEAELEVSRFNLYDEITDLFLSELCIYLY